MNRTFDVFSLCNISCQDTSEDASVSSLLPYGYLSPHNRALCLLHMVRRQLVMIHLVTVRICVDNHLGYSVDAMEEAVADLLSDGVGFLQRQLRVDLDVHRDM